MSQPTPFDNILTQSRDLFCERLAAAVAGMLDKTDEALTALESETRDAETQGLYRETREKLTGAHDRIESQFHNRYLREFQQRSNRAKKIGVSFNEIEIGDVELALVGEEDFEETLKFDAMTGRLRQYCEEEIGALDQRVGVLFGDADLKTEDNPFAPAAITEAWKQTCAQVDERAAVRLLLLKLFDQYVLDQVRGIYREVNALLVQNDILPKLRVKAVARSERSKPAEQQAPDRDLFAMLQNLVAAPGASVGGLPAQAAPGAAIGASGTAAGAAAGAPQAFQGANLMRSLTRVQLGDLQAVGGDVAPLAAVIAEPGTTNVLRELKSTSLGSGMSQMDAMTLDIVALLFDQLFDDPNIPIGIKGLIGRLQIPFLKVAIADKAFFAKKAHPARHMLDTLGEVAARLPADVNASSATYVRLDELLQGVMEKFEDNVEIFDEVREELEKLLVEEDHRIEEQAQATETQVAQQESLALAKTVAQTEIKMRLRATDLPQPIVDFLIRQWLKVLLLIQVREGEHSESWKRAIETMDLLIWSVEPKDTREARGEVVAKVPDLLKRLADALKGAYVEDEVRTGFFTELRRLHSDVIAGTVSAAAVADQAHDMASAEAEQSVEDAGEDLPGKPREPLSPEAPEAQFATPQIDAEESDEDVTTSGSAAEMPAMEFTLAAEASEKESVEESRGVEAAEATPALDFAATESEAAPAAPEQASVSMGFELPALDLPSAEVETSTAGPEESPPGETATAESGPGFELPSLEIEPTKEAVPEQAIAANEAQREAPAALELPALDFGPADAAPVKPAKPATPPEKPQAVEQPALDFAQPGDAAAPGAGAPPREKPPALELPVLEFDAAPAAASAQPARERPHTESVAAPPAKPAQAAAPAVKPTQPVAAAKPQPAPAPAKPAPAAPIAKVVPPQPAPPQPAPKPATATPPAAPAAAKPPPQPAPVRPAQQPAALRAAPAAAAPRPSAQPAVKRPVARPADLSAPVKVANPFGEGQVEVGDLDFTMQLGPSKGGAKPASPLPPELKIGAWVELALKAGKPERQVAKLAFISPLKTRYVFADSHGKPVLECSQAALVRHFQQNEITLSRAPTEKPLFDRLAEGVAGKLGAQAKK